MESQLHQGVGTQFPKSNSGFGCLRDPEDPGPREPEDPGPREPEDPVRGARKLQIFHASSPMQHFPKCGTERSFWSYYRFLLAGHSQKL